MKIGIDFGSTYSTFSVYDERERRARALTLTEDGTVNVPSIVSLEEDGGFDYGKGAKERVGEEDVRIFEAFKMLLIETNKEMLKKRNYDEEYTPGVITEYFLEQNLVQALERSGTGDKKYEDVVICVPEIWSRGFQTLDGKNLLINILQSERMRSKVEIDHVRVVKEPEAASAFFAHNFEKETGEIFNGHLLLIDYGGGTLDITLTEVHSKGDGTMEICCREDGGAGENHPDEQGNGDIGTAGIAYMQNVIRGALCDAGILGANEQPDYTSPSFQKAVKRLETDLMTKSHQIRREFASYSDLDEILEEEPIEFGALQRYEGRKFKVTYQQLYRSYKEIIEQVLRQNIDEINEKVAKRINGNPCTPDMGTRNSFKIALVGGFGTFYLVQRQVEKIYNFSTSDLRKKNISVDNREQAISLGAALIAEGVVTLKKTAQFSIGLFAQDPDGIRRLHYAIQYHQELETGRPYFILDAETGEPIIYASLNGNVTQFAIGFNPDINEGSLMRISSKMSRKLDALPEYGFWNVGFSVDENDVLTMHILPAEGVWENENAALSIVLDSYRELFDLTEVRRVRNEI